MKLRRLGTCWLAVASMVAGLGACNLKTSDEGDDSATEGGGCYTAPDTVGQGAIDGPECEARLAAVINSCDSRGDKNEGGDEGDGLCRDFPTNSGECLLGTWAQSQLCDRTEELGFCIQVISSIDKDDWWLMHWYPEAGKDDCEATQKAAQLCTISPARTWCNTKFPQR